MHREWLEERRAAEIDRRIGQSLGKTAKSWPATAGAIHRTLLNAGEMGLGDDAILGLLETGGKALGMEKSAELAAQLSDGNAAVEVLRKIQLEDGR